MGAKKGLIFGSSPCESWDFLRPYAQWPDLVIAADGGLTFARMAGFSPSAYVGDGDSGGREEPGLRNVVLPEEKDVTDLEAAYDWAKEQGVTELLLTGCTGGRLDHHMAAMGLLETARGDGIHGVILDPRNRIEFLTPGTYAVPDLGYRYFSLIPVERMLVGLCIRGAKYPLENRDVHRGDSLTISNEFARDTVEISFREGCCYLIQADRR